MAAPAIRKTILLLVALTALLAVVGVLVQRWCAAQPASRAAAVPYQSGVVLAELAARHGGAQPRILLVLPDAAGGDNLRDWLQQQRRALEKKLPSGTKIVGVETVTGGRGQRAGFTLAALGLLLKKYAAATLVVSLAGAPVSDVTEAKLPPVICFAPDGEHVAELMKRGLLAAAIVPRNQRVPIDAAGGDWFDVLYQVVTPANLAAWQSGVAGH